MGSSESAAIPLASSSSVLRSVTVTLAPASAQYRAEAAPPPCAPSPMIRTRAPASSEETVFELEFTLFLLVQVHAYRETLPESGPVGADRSLEPNEGGIVLAESVLSDAAKRILDLAQ